MIPFSKMNIIKLSGKTVDFIEIMCQIWNGIFLARTKGVDFQY